MSKRRSDSAGSPLLQVARSMFLGRTSEQIMGTMTRTFKFLTIDTVKELINTARSAAFQGGLLTNKMRLFTDGELPPEQAVIETDGTAITAITTEQEGREQRRYRLEVPIHEGMGFQELIDYVEQTITEFEEKYPDIEVDWQVAFVLENPLEE